MKGSLSGALACSPELVCRVGVCDGKEATTHHLPSSYVLLCGSQLRKLREPSPVALV